MALLECFKSLDSGVTWRKLENRVSDQGRLLKKTAPIIGTSKSRGLSLKAHGPETMGKKIMRTKSDVIAGSEPERIDRS